jgi:arylsulfatase
MMGNRGIYHKGWTAVTKHRTPWVFTAGETPAFDDDHWELYDTNTDWTQAHDLAAEMPDKLGELQRLWLIEATKHNVLPLDDRVIERFNADLAGRPQLVRGSSQLLFAGMGRLSENIVLNIKNKSHSVTAEIVIPDNGARGVIVAQGGSGGGWSIYAHDGKLKYCYNLVRRKHFFVESADELPAGTHQVRMEFAYDGGGLAKGGDVTPYLDGTEQASGRVEQTIPYVFSLDEGVDIGREFGTTVSPDYPIGGACNESGSRRGRSPERATGGVEYVGDPARRTGHSVAPSRRAIIASWATQCRRPRVIDDPDLDDGAEVVIPLGGAPR